MFDLPYNKSLLKFAKQNRRAGVLSEALLWLEIKNGKLCGLDFDRQRIIGNYIVDFYCPIRRAVIEIDGDSHDEKNEYDKERDKCLANLGLKVIHIHDHEVKKNMRGVLSYLRSELR
jgi:very-short-patch-repair endonuclease